MSTTQREHVTGRRTEILSDIRVMLYHRVIPGTAGDGERADALPADEFRKQLLLLERWGYTPITFNDYRLIGEGELTSPRKPIILTFDRGYRETYDVAVPILREFGMKAVIFVPGDPAAAGNVPDGGSQPGQTGLMADRHVLELHQNGFEIGSHSLTHRRLTLLPREQAWDEIARARMKLEIMLNARVHTFAYPYGLLNKAVKEMVAAAGYRYACSAWSGPTNLVTDPYEIRRIRVSPSAGTAEFALKVLGPYPAYRSFRSKARALVNPEKPPCHVSQARTLFLVSAGLHLPERDAWARRETEDQYPRQLPLFERLNAEPLDERFLAGVPFWRSALTRPLGTGIAQVLEALYVRKRYDVIVSWAEHLGLPLAGLFPFVRKTTPHVAIFSWISKPKKARILQWVHPSIDRIILMSSAQRDFAVNALRIPRSRIALLKWPVDEKFWRPLGAPQDMICAVGREMRDYATLIDALRGSDIPCHIAAGGQLDVGKDDPWIRELSRRDTLPGNVTVGGMNFADLRKLYDRSRFVVIPLFETDTDNGTTSILEAMSMGKAVICSRVKGQLDVIQDGITGLFVPPGDAGALRAAITALWSNPERAEEMGRRGREHIERHHALDGWVNDVQQVVAGVLGGGVRRAAPAVTEEQGFAAPVAEPGATVLLHETR